MIPEVRDIKSDVLNYLNTYPAFTREFSHGSIMDPDFYERVMWSLIGSVVEGRNLAVCHAIWDCKKNQNITMEDAEEFLRWLDPYYRKYLGKRYPGFDFKNNDYNYYLGTDDLVEI